MLEEYTLTLSKSADFSEGVHVGNLYTEIRDALPDVPLVSIVIDPDGNDNDRVDIIFERELTSAEMTALTNDQRLPAGGLLAVHDSASRALLFAAVDVRTRELISNGYLYDGCYFSVSEAAQIKLIALIQDVENLQFPFTLACLDDEDPPYSVENAAVLGSLLSNFRSHLQVCIDSGETIKAQIRAAATYSEAEAIEDNR